MRSGKRRKSPRPGLSRLWVPSNLRLVMGFLTSFAALTPGQGSLCGSQDDFIRLPLQVPSLGTHVQLNAFPVVGYLEPHGHFRRFYKVVCIASPVHARLRLNVCQGQFPHCHATIFLDQSRLGLAGVWSMQWTSLSIIPFPPYARNHFVFSLLCLGNTTTNILC